MLTMIAALTLTSVPALASQTDVISQRNSPLQITACSFHMHIGRTVGGKTKIVWSNSVRARNVSSDTLTDASVAVFGVNGSGDIMYWESINPDRHVASGGSWPFTESKVTTTTDANLVSQDESIERFYCGVAKAFFAHRDLFEDESISQRLAAAANSSE